MRNAALDLSRFLAATIVLFGHFLFSDEQFQSITNYPILRIFHTGFQSVDYFFCLSGFVLTRHGSVGIGLNWIKARLVRLMPIYWVCWVGPFIVYFISSRENLPNLSGALLALIASQSWSITHYLDAPNPPLWSLSVEIWLSILLIPIARIKNEILFLLLTISLTIVAFSSPNPILRGLPFFLIGIGIAKLTTVKPEYLEKKYFFIIFLFFTIIYWIIIPYIDINFMREQHFTYLLHICGSISTLVIFSKIRLGVKAAKFSAELGKRSYVIYAAHAPMLFFYSQVMQRIIGTVPKQYLFLYFLAGLICTSVIVEFLYQVVEVKAISKSRKIKSRN